MPEHPDTSPFTFHLDAPETWTDCPRIIAARGWLFALSGEPITGLRARIADTWVAGTLGHHRPDVREAFPTAPDDHCGFQLAARCPTGEFEVEIQARTEATEWSTVFTTIASAPASRRSFAWGGGSPEELLQGQLTLVPEHSPRPIRPDALPTRGLDPAGALITVVTPSYNQAEWLGQNIASVHYPSSDRIRHLVMDGGSRDGSKEVLENHHEHLAHWVSETDGGQADAIAKGFEHPAGRDAEIMAWLNADDHYLPGTLPFVQRYFETHPEVEVLYGDRIIVDEDDAEVGAWILPPHDNEVLRMYDFVPQETLFWRRSIWEKVGGIDRSFQFALDWDLLLRFAEAGANIMHVPYKLGAFRVHHRQKSAAAMGQTGQNEIDSLRRRTWGREITPSEIINYAPLQRYLRASARETLWQRWGVRRWLRR